jgi:hypothetical protein
VQHAHPMQVLLWVFAAIAAAVVLTVVLGLVYLAFTGADDEPEADDHKTPPAAERGLPPFFTQFAPPQGGSGTAPPRPIPPRSVWPSSPPPPAADPDPFLDPASIFAVTAAAATMAAVADVPPPPPPPSPDPGPSIDAGSTAPDCGACDPGCGC